MKVIGIVEQSGTYEGNQYHNLVFHCTKPVPDGKGVGQVTMAQKVKVVRLAECFGRNILIEEVMALLGEEVTFSYDEYKNVIQIRIIEEAKPEGKKNVKEAS